MKIGGKPVKKTTLYIAGAAGVLVVAYAVWHKRSAAASTTAGTVTDPAGNTCSAVDPNSGYCPGTAGDTAYYQQSSAGLSGGSSVAGGGGFAYPVTPGSGISTPGSVVPTFTDNASWAQYVEAYMVSLGGDPNTIGNALGKYITGQQVTADQQSLIEQAIAYGNKPPVGGADGFPPSIRLAAAGGGNPPPGGTLAAPANFSVTPHAHAANFGWHPVPGAHGYELELDKTHEHAVTGEHFSLSLPAGSHTARVRANGGAWTATKTFTVPAK